MSAHDDLETIAFWLDKEAEHWRNHPDYFTPKRDSVHFTGKSHKEAHSEIQQWLAEHVNRQRGTHTDIVLRDRAAQIRRHAETIKAQAAEIERLRRGVVGCGSSQCVMSNKLIPCSCGYTEAAGEPT